jgi:hypothetical protein
VGPEAGRDNAEKLPTGIRSPVRPAHNQMQVSPNTRTVHSLREFSESSELNVIAPVHMTNSVLLFAGFKILTLRKLRTPFISYITHAIIKIFVYKDCIIYTYVKVRDILSLNPTHSLVNLFKLKVEINNSELLFIGYKFSLLEILFVSLNTLCLRNLIHGV